MSARDQVKRIKEIERNILPKRDVFRRVFDNVDGQQVLQYLKDEFEPSMLFNPDPYVTTCRAAQRDVIRYIEDLMNYEEKSDV
jgi:hypothetical protein